MILVAGLILIVLFLVFVAVIWLFYGTRWGLGKVGEHRVKKALGKDEEGKHYSFHNLIVKTEDGRTHQIDSLYLTHTGLLVIETKLWQGQIYGNDKMDTWYQYVKKDTDKWGRKTKTRHYKNEMENPVKQNWGHVYALKEVLGNGIPLVPLVVFARDEPPKHVTSSYVTGLKGLKKKAKEFEGNALSEDAFQRLKDELTELQNGQVSGHEHVKNVKALQHQVDENICPRCGGKLVLRHGRNGDFYGCSNYPRCTFTKRMNPKE